MEFLSPVKFPAVFAFWHGRMFVLPFIFRDYGEKVYVLISKHADGEVAADIVNSLGFKTVRGSTGRGKGGDKAFLKMVTLIEEGNGIAITPDGPMGPAQKVKLGTAKLSLKTGVPVYPISFSAYPKVNLNSWDKFMVPLPFSKCVVKVGNPIFPDGFSEEELAKEIELRLKELSVACDEEVLWKR